MVVIPPIRRKPVLLTGGTRIAGTTRRQARMAGAIMLLFALLAIATLLHAGGAAIDPSLADGIVDGIRHGARYYDVATDASRQAGQPLVAWAVPLPSVAIVTGMMSLAGAIATMWVLGVAVVLAWWGRLPGLARGGAGQILGAGLIAVRVASVAWPTLVAVPEAWAGLLVALSLARWRPEAPLEAAAFGLAAAAAAPGALLYLGCMTVAALGEGRRREAAAWTVAGAIGLAVLAAHAHALSRIGAPLDGVALDVAGIDLARIAAPGLAGEALPFAFAVIVFVLSVVGWIIWRGSIALRGTAVIATTALVAFASGSLAIGLIAAPVLLLGLLALPDLIGDLAATALDKRRIIVTRLAR